MREVARVVEVDGVAEVDLFQLVEDRGGVVQRAVEVDPLDPGARASTVMPVNGLAVVASLAATRSIPSVTERRYRSAVVSLSRCERMWGSSEGTVRAEQRRGAGERAQRPDINLG
ncbi:hypothetical protein SAV14893_048030 [Streptomyces avermitilis]|uniref:Uncharacterized protein n=1 Tax=Streptomyces avermitilis TaxID=33903 RepID=A0A4D4LZ62_STRAX|nr:hypothetical protein SAV14893_048030 [Streptomyces avermitilis]GDY74383.1 hypothetical protein SAV31267_038680 [Streptomyces avermitilis]